MLFFVFNFPLSVGYILTHSLKNPHYQLNADFMDKFNFFVAIALNFSYLLEAFDFFIALTINKLFRREVLGLLFARRTASVDASSSKVVKQFPIKKKTPCPYSERAIILKIMH
jgi:hypothetical protein